jgi:hypothetical protein
MTLIILMSLNCDGGDVSLLILRIKYRLSLQRSIQTTFTQNFLKYERVCNKKAGDL